MQEEHCAIILYPGDEFAGHVVPPGGTANALAEEIEQFIRERGIDMEKVKSLVSDGCEKMVEWEKGVQCACNLGKDLQSALYPNHLLFPPP